MGGHLLDDWAAQANVPPTDPSPYTNIAPRSISGNVLVALSAMCCPTPGVPARDEIAIA